VSTRLDALVQRARAVGVRDDHAHEYVAQLAQWSAEPQAMPRRTWVPWLFGGLGFAAAAVLLLLLVRRDAPQASPLALGDRVAIIAEPDTAYRIARADRGETIVDVERGTVTARLWPGDAPHRLVLRGGAVEAVATGTVYSLTVDAGGKPSVAVHEGTVDVALPHDPTVDRVSDTIVVERGTRWPRDATASGAASARVLLAAQRPPAHADAVAIDADADVDALSPSITVDAPAIVVHADAGDPQRARDPKLSITPVDAAASPSLPLNERWRLARLYRGQGNYDAAVKECLAIADANDKTWSPIALVEAIRIELGPLTSPERALALADRFARDWPSHDLGPEARELRCRALRQLGRDAECTPSK
jgi:hypothetical protein